MKLEDIPQKLFVSTSEKYGDKYIDHLLEQYKIYIDSAEKTSDRRQKNNEFFLGLNTALVSLLGFITTTTSHTSLAFGLASIVGITMCYLWYRILRSYKGLNTGKFTMIHAIETRLPLAIYNTEWELLDKGKNKKIYWPFSHIELCVPWIFMTIYIILFLSILPWQFILYCLFFKII
jgi:hypothetical protein